MCKRPWAVRPAADGSAAPARGEASLHQEPAEPPSLQRDKKIRQKYSEPYHGSSKADTSTDNHD